jgi:hypothetical protein
MLEALGSIPINAYNYCVSTENKKYT